jgi:protein-S-isoprenylcysteine O-methyltransferase Ste14
MTLFDWCVIGFLVLALAERVYERRFSDRAVRGENKMEWSYTLLHTSYSVLFLGVGLEHFLWKRPFCAAATVTGLVLYGVALAVRLSAIRALGRYWSLHLEIRQDHQLMTEGIYRHMRHPAYSAIMLEVVSVPLVANAYGMLVFAVGWYVTLILLRWHREEREMIAKFGEQYVRYRERVPAFVPWRSLWPGKRASS